MSFIIYTTNKKLNKNKFIQNKEFKIESLKFLYPIKLVKIFANDK